MTTSQGACDASIGAIQSLARQSNDRIALRKRPREPAHFGPPTIEQTQNGPLLPPVEIGHAREKFEPHRNGFFRSTRWSRRAKISRIIDQRPIGFMTDRRDQRQQA